VVHIWTLDVLDDQVQSIRAIMNPDKLRHLGPVADGWAVLRETQDAWRRSRSSDVSSPSLGVPAAD
jgi:RNA polymerase sigma-70 factor (ECF subfamily)